MSTLDDLTQAVQAETDVAASAAMAINGLVDEVAKLQAQNNDPALAALVTKLKASASALAAAIPVNTAPVPVAPPAPPVPVPPTA